MNKLNKSMKVIENTVEAYASCSSNNVTNTKCKNAQWGSPDIQTTLEETNILAAANNS